MSPTLGVCINELKQAVFHCILFLSLSFHYMLWRFTSLLVFINSPLLLLLITVPSYKYTRVYSSLLLLLNIYHVFSSYFLNCCTVRLSFCLLTYRSVNFNMLTDVYDHHRNQYVNSPVTLENSLVLPL